MAEDKNIKQQYLNFDEYIRQGEPEKKERAEAWSVYWTIALGRILA